MSRKKCRSRQRKLIAPKKVNNAVMNNKSNKKEKKTINLGELLKTISPILVAIIYFIIELMKRK